MDKNSILFKDVNKSTICWMSHTDYIAEAPEGFVSTATTPNCPFAAMENAEKNLYATQFHPEVMHTEEGMKMLRAFVMDVCKCSGDWKMDSFVEDTIKSLREKIGNGKVLCALSGGVIHRLQPFCYPRQLVSSLLVYLSIRDFFVRTRVMKSKQYLVRMVHMI